MKKLLKKSAIAIGVSLVLGSSPVWAVDPPTDGGGPQYSDPTKVEIEASNETSVDLSKKVSVSKDYNITTDEKTGVTIAGLIKVDSASMAVVDDKQLNYDVGVHGGLVDPTMDAKTGTINGNAGNVGVNVTAGVANQQDNAAALSDGKSPVSGTAAGDDRTQILGSTDAEVFTNQSLWHNNSDINGAKLSATTDSINSNAGNLGVNVSAGVSNLQKNNLAISTGESGLAEASSATLQETHAITSALNDVPANVLGVGAAPTSYTSDLGAISANSGNVGVNLASGTNNLQANTLAIASQ